MLNEIQLATFRAAIDRIIPRDDFPGAWDAGAGDFIVNLLETDLQSKAMDFQTGLDCLERESQKRAKKPFAQLSESEIDALLTRIESGKTTTDWPIDPRSFFRILVELTAEGYYSDSGNRISWAMIGYDPGANAPL